RRELAAATQASDQRSRVEDCRVRLQSVELLLDSSPRDALALARSLMDDMMILLAALYLPAEKRAGADSEAVMRALPSTETRDHLAAARRWADGSEAANVVSAEGILALRHVVTDLTRAMGRTDLTGLAAFRQILRRTTWIQAGIGAAVVLAILVVAMQMRSGREHRAAGFEALFSEAAARLGAGDHAQAVELYRKAIAAKPD